MVLISDNKLNYCRGEVISTKWLICAAYLPNRRLQLVIMRMCCASKASSHSFFYEFCASQPNAMRRTHISKLGVRIPFSTEENIKGCTMRSFFFVAMGD